MTAAWRTCGQPAALAAVMGALRTGSLPHALLLVGPAGSGKTTLALDLAAALLCEAPRAEARPCRTCPACRRVEHGNHPDLHRLAPGGSGRQIRIGERIAPEPGTIRALVRDLALAPMEGSWRVAIVESAEHMNENAQNALLKLLEEPPLATVLVLCAADEDVLLPTVRSRCVRIRLAAVPPDEIAAQLVRDGVDPHRAASLARMARGSIGRARAMAAAPEAALVHEQILRELLDLTLKDRADRLGAAAGLIAAADQLESLLGGPEKPASQEASARSAAATARSRSSAGGGRRKAGASGSGSNGDAGGSFEDAVDGMPPDAAVHPESDDRSTRPPAALAASGEGAEPEDGETRERQSPAARRRAVLTLGEAWREVARDLAVAARGGGGELRHVELLEDLRAAASAIGPGPAERFLARLGELLPAVEQNANPELALDALLLEWPGARSGA